MIDPDKNTGTSVSPFIGFVSVDLSGGWDDILEDTSAHIAEHADSTADALILSLTTKGCVDIDHIAALTGEDIKSVISSLKGSIYQNPDTWCGDLSKGWETKEEYLSGNLIKKLDTAVKANELFHGRFADNIEAIKSVMPTAVTYEDIYVTLGSPWLPSDIIDEFIFHICGNPYEHRYGNDDYIRRMIEHDKTIHDDVTGTWEIPNKNRYSHSVAVKQTYGTPRMEALHIIEKTLNMQTITVKDEIETDTTRSGKKLVINKKETVAAIEKQNAIINEFETWIWTDEDRKKRLQDIFTEKYGCIIRRVFDGSFLTFPGMSSDMQLFKYQKDAAARIIFSKNTLLAHDVGAGKTYVMAAAGQELRRMGLSLKNLFVVPNNIVGQWERIYKTLYPSAKLMCISPKDFTVSKRNKILAKIRDEDYDGIIMASSCFDLIPMSNKYYLSDLKCKLKEVKAAIEARKISGGPCPNSLTRLHDRLRKELAKQYFSLSCKDKSICFDELGITRLFIDEAHNYKNVPVDTKSTYVLGIGNKGTRKCKQMMDKVHFVQHCNGGGGVVMATGTPITNSITDVYVMQMYLQSGELGLLNLNNFDSWIGMFAERVTEFEIDVDTSSYRLATRFARFHNLPELTMLLASVADFHQVGEADDLPVHNGYIDAVIKKTEGFETYLEQISARADKVRSGLVDRREDNMLKITSDGRKAALDMRLVDPNYTDNERSKVARCAGNVADLYFDTEDKKSTQVIFCDSSTPKDGFNMYDELKRRLIDHGIPEGEIDYIHNADTEEQREVMFGRMCSGDLRILIGSTAKLGLGVNIQDKLIALHHLDIPWRPADMRQREGRIIRQGNTNPEVFIYRYITEGSFDAYSWQLLETKQRFITSLLSGSLGARSSTDIDLDSVVLDYAEVKALAVGNEDVKMRVEAENQLERYKLLQRQVIEARTIMEKELKEIQSKISHQRMIIQQCLNDIGDYRVWKYFSNEDTEDRKEVRTLINNALQNYTIEPEEKVITVYHGFKILLPAYMAPDKPYVLLVNSGRYEVELGATEHGNLRRIDNFINSLEDYYRELASALARFEMTEKDLRKEISEHKSYADEIKYYKQRVAELDMMLGVGKHE